MADYFEKVGGRIHYGTGYKNALCTEGSIEATKNAIIEVLQNEETVYMEYSQAVKALERVHQKISPIFPDKLCCDGFTAYPVPVSPAIEMLNHYKCDYFSSFYLCDTTEYKQTHPKAYRDKKFHTRYLLFLENY